MEEKELYKMVLLVELDIFEETCLESFLRFKAILKKREPLFKKQLLAYEKAFEEYIQVGRKYFDETQELPYFTEIAEIIPDNKWVHMFRDVIYPILTKNRKDHEPASDIFDQLGVTKEEFIDRVEKKKKGLGVM